MLKSKTNWIFANESYDGLSIVDQMFKARGIEDEEEKEKFLHPQLADLQAPEYLAQMERVKERIDEAIREEERVIVYGDYDADGVTSTTVLVKTLRELGVNCHFYIPNRFKEGYGIHAQAIEAFAEENVALVITVDTGIANVDEVKLANELGIDLIITDHHEVQDELPEAYAIIHPALSPNYDFKLLAGVGIAWQIAHYLIGDKAEDMLEFAAIGTVADLVPLIGENRVLVVEGLKRIKQTQSIGLRKLMQSCKLKDTISERDIAFMIGPRLNAVGRLQDASLAVQLLLTDDEDEAEMIAEEIEGLNDERQKIVQTIVREADERVDESDSFIILADEGWHEGVLGIAASRLVSSYQRPVMLLTTNNSEQWKGSARSVPGFNLFESFMKIKDLFIAVGGHSQAAGMSIAKENLAEIKAFLNREMEENFTGIIGKRSLTIDQTINLEQMTEQLVADVQKFAPFGMSNEKPLFHLEARPVQVRKLGQDQRHLKLQFKHDNQFVEAIGFRFGDIADFIGIDSEVEIVGELQLNEWNGKVTVQMNIQDLAIEKWQLFDYRGKRHLSTLLPYIEHYDKNTIVCQNLDEVKEIATFDHVKIITYDTNVDTLAETELLYLYDMPNNLDQLTTIMKETKPKSMHVAFNVTNGGLLHTRPNREQFKQVYIYLASFASVALKEHYPQIMKATKLRKEQLSFILKVFYDLHFIRVKDNVVTLNRDAEKADLTTSRTYQERINQEEAEEKLYYSSHEELKQWLLQQLQPVKQEDLAYGL